MRPYGRNILTLAGALLAGALALHGQTVTTTTTSVSLTFAKPNTPSTPVAVPVKASAGTVSFTVDMNTVPPWLNVTPSVATVDTNGSNLTFDQTSIVSSLANGTYSASVKIYVNGALALTIPVTLSVKSGGVPVTVPDAANLTFTWTRSLPYPAKTVTVLSGSAPVSVSISATATATPHGAVSNWINVATSVLAYGWGTVVNVTFNPAAFDAAVVGDNLTGSITFTPLNGAAPVVVPVRISVQTSAATITRVFPPELPVVPDPAAANRTIAVYGSNFVGSTVVKIGTANPPTVTLTNDCTAFAALADNSANALCVVNSSTMLIKLTEGTSANLGTAGPFYVSVQNGTTPVAQSSITVTTNPIVYALTDSASFIQPDFGTNPVVAPYELVTIFGENLSPGGTPTVAPSGTPLRYPNAATDPAGKEVRVSFKKASDHSPLTNDPDAYLLYVSNTQINLMVPSSISALSGAGAAEMVVTYDAQGTPAVGTAIPLDVAAAHPGIYTIDDVGTGAILNQDNTVNGAANPAKVGQTIQIFLTGMGVPNSTAANATATTAPLWPAGCVSVSAYLARFTGWKTLDGGLANTSTTYLADKHFLPCFTNTASSGYTPTTVVIGSGTGAKSAAVTYAGWVSGAITGLYQINATVPSGLTAGTYPIVVTIRGKSSQPGVYLNVTP